MTCHLTSPLPCHDLLHLSISAVKKLSPNTYDKPVCSPQSIREEMCMGDVIELSFMFWVISASTLCFESPHKVLLSIPHILQTHYFTLEEMCSVGASPHPWQRCTKI